LLPRSFLVRFLSDLFRDPTQVITSIPASLRYIPHRALVLTMVNVTAEPDTHPAGLLVRSVVTACDFTRSAQDVSALVRGAAVSIDACATLAVVVDDRLTDPDLGPAAPSAGARLVAELGNELETSQAPVIGAWATREIAAGSPWWTLNGRPYRGVLTDPALSAVALERLAEGQSLYRSRQALRDTLAPDPALTKLVDPLLPAAVSRAHQQRHRAVLHHDLTGYQRRGLETVLWRIADIAAGDTPTPAQLASLAVLMGERAVIDCLHTTVVSEAATAAEHLRTPLMRCLTGTAKLIPELRKRDFVFDRSSIYRLVKADKPPKISVELILALCEILDCRFEDLAVRIAAAEEDAPTASQGPRPALPDGPLLSADFFDAER
jgi:DNA-binding Xre family transcriptional regulator